MRVAPTCNCSSVTVQAVAYYLQAAVVMMAEHVTELHTGVRCAREKGSVKPALHLSAHAAAAAKLPRIPASTCKSNDKTKCGSTVQQQHSLSELRENGKGALASQQAAVRL